MCFTLGRTAVCTTPHVRQRENALQEPTGVCVAGRQVTRHSLRTRTQNQITYVSIGKRFPPNLACFPRGVVPFQPWAMHFDNIWLRKGVYSRSHRGWEKDNILREDHVTAPAV